MAMPNQQPLPPVPPQGTPPGAGPSPMGVPGLAQIMQRGAPPGAPTPGAQGGGIPPAMQQMLLFLAGIGFPQFAATLDKMKPKEPKTPSAKDAAANPAMTNPAQAQMIAKLAAMRAQGGGAPPMPGMPPGGGAPGGAPAPNPMAMFGR